MEKRKYERLDANLFAIIRNAGEDEKIGRGVVVDVSLGGFAIETETDLTVDKEFEFDVEIPFTLRARVIRRLTPGQMKKYGLKMVGQSFFSRLLLKKLLKGKRGTIKI